MNDRRSITSVSQERRLERKEGKLPRPMYTYLHAYLGVFAYVAVLESSTKFQHPLRAPVNRYISDLIDDIYIHTEVFH